MIADIIGGRLWIAFGEAHGGVGVGDMPRPRRESLCHRQIEHVRAARAETILVRGPVAVHDDRSRPHRDAPLIARFFIIATEDERGITNGMAMTRQAFARRIPADADPAHGSRKSGGVASPFSIAIASASGMMRWPSCPRVRIATVPSSASRLPTTSR